MRLCVSVQNSSRNLGMKCFTMPNQKQAATKPLGQLAILAACALQFGCDSLY
jgi:hypothetical protein